MIDVFNDHFSIVYDICRAACHGDTALGRSSVKKLAALIESSTPDDAALLKRLTKKAAKNPAHFVQSNNETSAPPAQTAITDDARDAIRRAALKEAANLCAIVSTDANRRRKTSDNPTYMEGKSDGAEDCETRILRMIDAAVTAAQSGDKS